MNYEMTSQRERFGPPGPVPFRTRSGGGEQLKFWTVYPNGQTDPWKSQMLAAEYGDN